MGASGLEARLAALSPDKRRLLARQNPPSFAQQRLWFLAELRPDSPFYNGTAALRLTGDLDARALAETLAEVVRRHDVLRAVFARVDGQPLLLVTPPLPLALPVVDLSALPGPAREGEKGRVAREQAARPFDLARGPLFVPLLLRIAEREHRLLVSAHHAICDRLSLEILFREVARLYTAFSAGRPSPLPPLPLQFPDYVRWQRATIAGERLDALLGWWTETLAGPVPALELPADRPRPAVPTYRGRRCLRPLPRPLGPALRELARAERATPFAVGLAAFAALLSRWAGQRDLWIGSPVAGRPRRDFEDLIGLFLNTLVLRVRVPEDASFRDLVAAVGEVVLAAHEHQDLPFETLVQALQPERDLSRNPLFQVMFAFLHARSERLELPGLEVAFEEVDRGAAMVDLSLTLTEGEDGQLTAVAEQSSDLFDVPTVERLLRGCETLLESLAADPDERIADVPLLAEAERHQVLIEWNDSRMGVDGGCLHELFERQAERRPEAVALVADGVSWTYRELARRARALAHHLRGLAAGPETVVGVFLERTPDLVVALLGILEAGGAYLPLDPSHPRERLGLILADAGAPLLLTREELRASLPPYRGRVVSMGDGEPEPGPPFSSGAGPESLAYVLYTSGSTGRPKGVLIPHAAVVSFLASMRLRPGLAPGDRLLALTTVGFDISVLEIFLPLATGATVILGSRELTADPARLRAAVAETGATAIQATPAQWRLWLAAGWEGEPGLAALCGGEAMPPDLARELAARCGSVWNLYGPTETTVWSAVERVGDEIPGTSVPIGRPIGNTRLQVLDPSLRPVPCGVAGELYIGGAGLARGYLGRPGGTAERFVPDPFGGPGERLYRTGDLARHRPDGRLEFLGRADLQVKVRGFRIEPAEVEAALRLHPGVAGCAVAALGPLGGDRRLAAYVVPRDGAAPGAAELRAHLAERLPSYMVPSVFVPMAALPLSPSGKVDRKALPAPPAGRPEAGDGFVPPETPTEEVLAGIWAGLLGVERVGRADRFFDLGGHSLLSTRLLARIRETFRIDLPLLRLFEEPTLAALAESVDRAVRQGAGTAPPPIGRAPRDGRLPLSFAQRRLWFLEQLDPGNPAYHLGGALRFEGRLDVAALASAFEEVVRRHEVLRTTFPVEGGEPMQAVAPPGPCPLPVVDLAGLPGEARDAEALRWMTAEARRPFDLVRGPLVRVLLLRRGREEHEALLALHHIVCDGWSMSVLTREVLALYASSPLPGLPVQYADFAVWQRAWLAGPVLASQLAYWRGRLAGSPAALELPADRPRPSRPSHRGRSARIELPAEPGQRLLSLCRERSVTPFMALLAAFQTLLLRSTGQSDLPVGSVVANRTVAELEGLIGFFVNTLVLRSDLAGDPPFGELLARVRPVCLEAYSHQDVPFERLVDELRPERRLGQSPFFQAMFSLQNLPRPAMQWAGLTVRPVTPPAGTAKFDLVFNLVQEGSGFSGSLDGDADLFDAATVERMAGHLRSLLEAAIAGADRPLSALPLLTPAERAQVRVEWGAVREPAPAEPGVARSFAEQVRRQPEALAVLCGSERLTYAGLDRRAARLAQRLRARGAGPEMPVGVVLERSADVVVALLAILGAGAAYVPLEPSLPPERLALLLADSGARLLIARPGYAGPVPPGAEVVPLAAGEPAGPDAEWPAVPVLAESLAYLIYTSGSTGRPKGVEVGHGTLSSHCRGMIEVFGLTREDRVVQLASLGFDASIEQMLGALLAGGCLVIRGPEPWGPAELRQAIDEHGLTMVNLPTGYWQQWVGETAAGGPWDGGRLRLLIAGGDAMTAAAARGFHGLGLRRARLLNAYGPTEAVITATVHPVLPLGPEDCPHGRVPVGRPTPGRSAHVLDARGEPVPAGVAGELAIGGPHLARGYRAHPGLTAARFVPDPFAAAPGARLYRTGDLARRLPDGTLEFLGRADDQVKVRGFRVEPGEVEAALARLPGVRDAVVVAREDPPAGKRLVAYVVPADGPAPAASELRGALARVLPEFMIPAAFVALDALPLTAHGKVDRRALPPPEPAAPGDRPEAALPRDPVEAELAGIWADLLGGGPVGIHDSFFELGGHSLLATRVVSRVRSAFGVELPLRALFEEPTVAGLAARIGRARDAGESLGAPPLAPAARTGGVPLSFAQQRLWFLYTVDPGRPDYNIPISARLSGRLDAPALAATLREIVRRHEVLRTSFEVVDGLPLQVVGPPPAAGLAVVDLEGLPPEAGRAEALALAQAEARRPFDLASPAGGALLRSTLLRLGPGEHVALLTLHHIAADGWSVGVLVRELGALYGAFTAGLPSPLPALPVQYADFALWQRRWLEGGLLSAQLAYWRRQLAGLPVLALPTDRPRLAVRSLRGRHRPVHLPVALGQAVRALAERESATSFMTLLAAFAAALRLASGQDDVVVGTDVANRSPQEVEGLVGFFVNQLVLRIDLSGDPTFRELLGRVREVALAAYAHQDLPFERLVAELETGRDLSRTPLFQVKLVLQTAPAGRLSLPGLAVDVLPLERETAKFDLLLDLTEGPEGFSGRLEHSADLFEPATVERLLARFEAFARWGTARPEARLAELEAALAEEERRAEAQKEREFKESNQRRLQRVERRAVRVGGSR